MRFNKLISKKIEIRYLILLSLLFTIAIMIYGGILKSHILYNGAYGKLGKATEKIADLPHLVKQSFVTVKKGTNNVLIIENNFPNLKGLTYTGNVKSEDGFLLNSHFDTKLNQSIVDLIDLNNQSVIHKWVLPLEEISNTYKISVDGEDSRILHPLLLDDGAIIVNMHHCVFKLDSTSALQWVVLMELDHSIEMDADGNIFLQGRPWNLNYKDRYGKMYEDRIVKLNTDGKILWEKSIADLLVENKLTFLLMGAGIFMEDPMHVNEIRPALTSSKYWQKDDLLISIRNISTILLYRPSENKVLWYKMGPWINQHCPDFLDSSKISVFGNDTFRNTNRQELINGFNNLYIFDLATNQIDTSYKEAFFNCKIGTKEEGRAKVLKNGDVFVVENKFGRILRINKKNSVWEFVNNVDRGNISITGWDRYLTKNGACKFCLTEN